MKSFCITLLSLFTTISFITHSWAKDLRIGTFNIRNYNYDAREQVRTNDQELAKLILQTSPDLLAIQEIVHADVFKQFIEARFSDYGLAIGNCGGAGRQKLGFLYKKSTMQLVSFSEDQRLNGALGCNRGVRPALIAKFKLSKTPDSFTAMALHLKAGGEEENNEQRFKQLNAVTQILKEIKDEGEKNYLVMGDLNTTDYNQHGSSYQRFITFSELNNLADFSQHLECTSYWSGKTGDGIEESSVLDHVMISKNFLKQFFQSTVELFSHCQKVSCDNVSAETLGVTYMQVSDHCPVVANLKK